MQADYVFKIVVLGDSGVGKTSFIHSLQHHEPCTKGSTIGVDFSVTTIQVGEKLIKAQIWDTAGQEQFRSISRSYFRNVAGALLFYDVTNQNSYKNIGFLMIRVVFLIKKQGFG